MTHHAVTVASSATGSLATARTASPHSPIARDDPNCPHQVRPEVEAQFCELRREYPGWGPRRIEHQLAKNGIDPVPGPIQHLPRSQASRPDRAAPMSPPPRGVPPLGAGSPDAAVADRRDGRGRGGRWDRTEDRERDWRPQPRLRGRRAGQAGDLQDGVRCWPPRLPATASPMRS